MKIIVLSFFTLSLLISCGPSQKEIERQQFIEDSLHAIERKDVIDNVNKFFEKKTDTLKKNDTII